LAGPASAPLRGRGLGARRGHRRKLTGIVPLRFGEVPHEDAVFPYFKEAVSEQRLDRLLGQLGFGRAARTEGVPQLTGAPREKAVIERALDQVGFEGARQNAPGVFVECFREVEAPPALPCPVSSAHRARTSSMAA